MDDKKIVDLFFDRSEQAIKETAAKYGKYCYSIAFGILSNREDAEECVNDTYVSAWNSIPPHRPSALNTFLGKITRRTSIDRLRKQNAEKRGGGELPLVLEELQECIASDTSVEREFDRQRLSETVRRFVASLPATERNVFLCRYWYMEPIGRICGRFGFSESKVKSMLYRTREKLRALLEKEELQ